MVFPTELIKRINDSFKTNAECFSHLQITPENSKQIQKSLNENRLNKLVTSEKTRSTMHKIENQELTVTN